MVWTVKFWVDSKYGVGSKVWVDNKYGVDSKVLGGQ
jgi:hypothetical protein